MKFNRGLKSSNYFNYKKGEKNMMNIQEEIRAEKASYLDWDEIREHKAYEESAKRQAAKRQEQKKQEIKKTETYINKKLNNSNFQITQEDINQYPYIGSDNNIKNEWNNQVIKAINQTLEFKCWEQVVRGRLSPEIHVEAEDETLCYEEKIYSTDMFGNELDLIDVIYEPIAIIHVKFDDKDFHLLESNEYNELIVAANLYYKPKIITSGCVKYELKIVKEDN